MKISEMLREEHELIERYLNTMNGILVNLEQGDEVSDETLNILLAFFRDFFVGYHQRKEEELLFGVLEENGVFKETLPIEEMLHDHRKINILLKRIENLTPSVESETRRKTLAQSMDKFVRALRCHSRREDRVLYPMGDRLINPRDLEKLLQDFRDEEEKNREMIEGYVGIVVEFEEKKDVSACNERNCDYCKLTGLS